MRVISEERLIDEMKLMFHLKETERGMCIQGLIDQCKELNPWMTLEEFLKSGFVGKCWVFCGGFVVEAEYDSNGFWYVYRYLDQNTISDVQPIHKPEPPR